VNLVDDRYRIEALLGEGAVGAVYRAVDETTGGKVALKQWHAGLLNEEVRGRFLREATALSTLDHPNIVKVLGHGFVDGIPYVALEYLEGHTVESLLIGGKPLDSAFAFELARQALSAIAYAHEQHVVHRDLKPENIYITRTAEDNGEGKPLVKVLDYGLAKFMSAESEKSGMNTPLTATGMMIGTPLYMPPEQAAGSSVDLPVDVYAMGCVLFETLSGRPPYLAETNLELFHAHLRAPIPRLSDALSGMDVAPELQALIDRALAKKQVERFPNAGAMLEALTALPPSPIKLREQIPAAKVVLEQAPADAQHEARPSDGIASGSDTYAWIAASLLGVGALLLLWMRAC